jgi:hypothetical protein
MARPPIAPPRESFSGDDLVAYDRALERFPGTDYLGNPMMVSPWVGSFISAGGVMFRRSELRAAIPHKWREFTDLVLSENIEPHWNGAFHVHVADAVAHGIRPEAILAVREHRWDDLQADERQLVEYVRQMLTGTVTESAFEGICARFGERGAVEYTCFIGFLMFHRRLGQALGNAEPSDAELDALIESFVSGAADIPDKERGIPRPQPGWGIP